jgi:serine/threonine protein kinase
VTHSVLVQETVRGRVCECRFGQAPMVLGTAAGASFKLLDKQVSELHCHLRPEADGSLTVADTSTSGTWVNGEQVRGQAPAKAGDVLRLGPEARLHVLGVMDPAAPKRVHGILNVPQRIDSFILLRVVGRGAAGLVYEAYDSAADRRVAIKVMISGGRAAPPVVQRFKREAKLQGTLRDYPGIVSVYALGTVPDSGELYTVMEYVDGTTLSEQIQAGMPRLNGLRVMARVARAVDYAHDHGLVHRDLKPANVMVTTRDVIRLTDFGVCKALEDEDGMTATGVMLGTPCYMAPEQIDDAKRVGTPADIYALGVLLYVVLTGKKPFNGDSLRTILTDVEAGNYTPPIEVDPTIDPVLDALCRKAMHLVPMERPGKAREVATAIEDWLRRADPPTRIKLRKPGSK